MIHTIRCRHEGCGRGFTVRDEDLGAEAYCPSCTRACPIPESSLPVPAAVSAAPPADAAGVGKAPPVAASTPEQPASTRPTRSAKVFSATGTAEVSERVVRSMPCPRCHATLEVRVNDIGGTIYCHKCSLCVPIGDRLDPHGTAPPAPTESAVGITPKPVSRRRWLPLLLKGAASLLLAGTVAFGGYFTWHHPDEVPFAPASWKTAPLAQAPGEGGALAPGKDGDAKAAAPKKKAEQPITLALIDALLKRKDALAALGDAQSWEQMLMDQGVRDSDPRRRRLAEIIPRLTALAFPELATDEDTSAVHREAFRNLLQQLRTALEGRKLSDAQAAATKIDALLAAHSKELEGLTASYLPLKALLHDLELEMKGLRNVEALLTEAERHVKKGDVAAGLLAEARGKFLALRIPAPTEAEEKKLQDRVKRLTSALRLARGKRAVDDARLCLKDGDAQTRDLLVKEAEDFLSDQPTSQIAAPLAEARKLATQSVPRRDGSAFRRTVDFRLFYEEALKHFAVSETAAAQEACRKAQALTPVPKGDADNLAALVFELLQPTVQDRTLLPDTAPGLPAKLAEARKLLDDAAPWKADNRWKTLDAELRLRGGTIAREALARATKLALADKLKDAIAAAGQAEALGDRDTAARAAKLAQGWEAEQKARLSAAAQKEHWERIERLQKDKKPFEAWQELQKFARRFPNSSREKQRQALDAELRPEAERRVEGMLDDLDKYAKAQDAKEFRKLYAVLMVAPLPAKYTDRVRPLRDADDGFKREAAGRFDQLKKDHRNIELKHNILALLDGLPKVLELSPDHAEAQALLQKVRTFGKGRAKSLVPSLDGLATPGKARQYKERLEEISKLDPEGDGPGADARLLLRKLKDS